MEHYNNGRLHSATGYITPKDKLPGVSRRSTPNATASWKPPDSNARVAASKPREEQATRPDEQNRGFNANCRSARARFCIYHFVLKPL